MPVTARLSKLFYERFGEQVTNELVDWFNQVDATYRNELRELNEANFARFDAKLEQRVVEIRGEFVQFRGEMRSEMAEFRGEIRSSLAELRGEFTSTIERSLRVQTAWFFVAWATMFATLVALELRR
jgi:hypothetical protein